MSYNTDKEFFEYDRKKILKSIKGKELEEIKKEMKEISKILEIPDFMKCWQCH